MKAYKFLDAADVSKMMNGTLLLRPLSYYRDLEIKKGPWIGDSLENIVRARSKVGDKIDLADAAKQAPPGYDYGSKDVSGPMVSGISVIYENPDDYFVFCATSGEHDYKSACQTMCVRSKRNPEPYDACIEIYDLQGLFSHIMQNGIVGPANFRAVLDRCEIKPVNYVKTDHKIGKGVLPAPNPFLKDKKKFGEQHEVRFAGIPNGRFGTSMVVAFPNAERFLRHVPLV